MSAMSTEKATLTTKQEVKFNQRAGELLPVVPTRSLFLDFNIRPDFLAQIILPYDMTEKEAARLIAFINALAVPDSEGA